MRNLLLLALCLGSVVQAEVAVPIVTKAGERHVVRIYVVSGRVIRDMYTDKTPLGGNTPQEALQERLEELANHVDGLDEPSLDDRDAAWKKFFRAPVRVKSKLGDDPAKLRELLAETLDTRLFGMEAVEAMIASTAKRVQAAGDDPERLIRAIEDSRADVPGMYGSIDKVGLKKMKWSPYEKQLLLGSVSASDREDPTRLLLLKSQTATWAFHFESESDVIRVTSDPKDFFRDEQLRIDAYKATLKKVSDTFWQDEHFFKGAYGGIFRDINPKANKLREERDIAYLKAKNVLVEVEAVVKIAQEKTAMTEAAALTVFARYEMRWLANQFAVMWLKLDAYSLLYGYLDSPRVASTHQLDRQMLKNGKKAGLEPNPKYPPRPLFEAAMLAWVGELK